MTRHIAPAQAATDAARAELVELLVNTLLRTFASEGPESAAVALRGMLTRLDESALRATIYEMGLEVEPPPEDGDDRPAKSF
jgi:hypothetical protein